MSAVFEPGRVVGGRFEVLHLLGRGGFGSVYAANQKPLDRLVALKILAREHIDRPDARDRFLREARAAARLNHPLVVGVIDYGVDPDGTTYIALEYIDGVELAQIIRDRAPLSIEHTARIARDILRALQAAHQLGIMHRDLKPSNVMATDSPLGGRLYKLLDFGLARAIDDEGVDFKTRSGVLTGTPYYMSPEQAVARGVGPATDQYALGVMLFQMLTGRLPFIGRTSFEVLAAHHATPAPRVSAFRPVPPALDALVARALNKAPEDRFPDVEAMLAALEGAVAPGAADDGGLPPTPEAAVEAPPPPAPSRSSVVDPASTLITPTPVDVPDVPRVPAPEAAPFVQHLPPRRTRPVQVAARSTSSDDPPPAPSGDSLEAAAGVVDGRALPAASTSRRRSSRIPALIGILATFVLLLVALTSAPLGGDPSDAAAVDGDNVEPTAVQTVASDVALEIPDAGPTGAHSPPDATPIPPDAEAPSEPEAKPKPAVAAEPPRPAAPATRRGRSARTPKPTRSGRAGPRRKPTAQPTARFPAKPPPETPKAEPTETAGSTTILLDEAPGRARDEPAPSMPLLDEAPGKGR